MLPRAKERGQEAAGPRAQSCPQLQGAIVRGHRQGGTGRAEQAGAAWKHGAKQASISGANVSQQLAELSLGSGVKHGHTRRPEWLHVSSTHRPRVTVSTRPTSSIPAFGAEYVQWKLRNGALGCFPGPQRNTAQVSPGLGVPGLLQSIRAKLKVWGESKKRSEPLDSVFAVL